MEYISLWDTFLWDNLLWGYILAPRETTYMGLGYTL